MNEEAIKTKVQMSESWWSQQGEEEQLALTADTLTPTHRVRVVLRTTDNHNLNPYVIGSDFYLALMNNSRLPSLFGKKIVRGFAFVQESTFYKKSL